MQKNTGSDVTWKTYCGNEQNKHGIDSKIWRFPCSDTDVTLENILCSDSKF